MILKTALACIATSFTALPAIAQEQSMQDTVHSRPAKTDKLYRSFGGREAIEQTVDGFIRQSLADPKVAHKFDETNMERFREQLITQLCWLMGGACAYEGVGMREAHAALEIDIAQFNAIVEHLQAAMDEASVSFRNQNKLLKLLALMKRYIVSK